MRGKISGSFDEAARLLGSADVADVDELLSKTRFEVNHRPMTGAARKEGMSLTISLLLPVLTCTQYALYDADVSAWRAKCNADNPFKFLHARFEHEKACLSLALKG